ncbi:MAG: transglycosylase SLT domain-containing protein [Alphaproteobacteria bacterium]|nr:transglycosylase SLT domain-containing protein [Alphaproteobacteria bacterium]
MLASLGARAPKHVMSAIEKASAKTGVSFSYLVQKAGAESGFNPGVKAKTSSATGLFQFIESTWMDMVKKHGSKYGIESLGTSKADILEMRKDPKIASFMAAEFARDNAQHLERNVGGKIGDTELYFAHFMGAGGASAFLTQLKKNPLNIAADLFPKEARVNRAVFYDSKTGQPRTLQGVYDFFDKKFGIKGGDVQVADVQPQSMAHKPKANAIYKSAGYQHMPLENPRSLSVEQNAYYSLFNSSKTLESFFGSEKTKDTMPGFFYSNLSNPTSVILSVLKEL